MTNTNSLSEIEKSKLHETTTKISELFIGDSLPLLDSISAPQEPLQREKLWLDCAIQAGPFETKTYWLSKALRNGRELLKNAANKTDFEKDLFPNIKDKYVVEFLTFITISESKTKESSDFAHQATLILNAIGYTDGLTDTSLSELTLNQVIEKLLLSSLGEEKKQ